MSNNLVRGKPKSGGPMRGNARAGGFADGSFDPVHD
jgi:hypothetical protein